MYIDYEYISILTRRRDPTQGRTYDSLYLLQLIPFKCVMSILAFNKLIRVCLDIYFNISIAADLNY